jgi:sugar phosphate isomerase/epimerase
MQPGIFAKTFAGSDPDTVLHAARNAGYCAVQYNMACSGLGPLPLAVSASAAQAVREASIQHGISIAAVSATYNMIHPDMVARKAGRQAFSAIASAAQMMGTRLITLCTGSLDASDQWRHHPDNHGDAAWREMRAEFDLLLEIAEQHDVHLGVEPELANVVASASQARRLIDEVGSERIRIVLDPANLFEQEPLAVQRRIISDALELLGDKIALAHAKDRMPDGGFATAGRGVIDWGHYLRGLKATGFDGALVTHGLAEAEAMQTRRFLQDALRDAAA